MLPALQTDFNTVKLSLELLSPKLRGGSKMIIRHVLLLKDLLTYNAFSSPNECSSDISELIMDLRRMWP